MRYIGHKNTKLRLSYNCVRKREYDIKPTEFADKIETRAPNKMTVTMMNIAYRILQ